MRYSNAILNAHDVVGTSYLSWRGYRVRYGACDDDRIILFTFYCGHHILFEPMADKKLQAFIASKEGLDTKEQIIRMDRKFQNKLNWWFLLHQFNDPLPLAVLRFSIAIYWLCALLDHHVIWFTGTHTAKVPFSIIYTHACIVSFVWLISLK